MKTGRRIIVVFLCFTILVGLLIALNYIIPGLVLITLPVSWPFLIIFGVDETTEKYGVVGEMWRLYLSSIPLTIIFSICLAVFAKGNFRLFGARGSEKTRDPEAQ
jgi:hypothetical protein